MKTLPVRRLALCLAAALAASLSVIATRAQQAPAPRFAPDRMDTFLYGAAFYEEYMPQDRLEKDVALMEQAGINVVRVGESTWSLWEPEDCLFCAAQRFDFGMRAAAFLRPAAAENDAVLHDHRADCRIGPGSP